MSPSLVLEQHARLLADISTALTSSIDVEVCLGEAVSLAVPSLADLFVVDVLEGDEGMKRVAFKLTSVASLSALSCEELNDARNRVITSGEVERAGRFLVAPLIARGSLLGFATAALVSSSSRLFDTAEAALVR